MLTETDIHYLVGLLSLAASPDNVDVELGSRVYDSAAEEHRDVDVTVSVKAADGQVTAFKGLEVKKHSRKLDSIHVEGLATKLNDMKDVTHRAIVSASGYWKPAIRKGAKHNVDLYEIVDWKSKASGFDFFQAEEVPFIQTSLEWAERPRVGFNPDARYSEEESRFFNSNPPVWFGNGESRPAVNNLIKVGNWLVRAGQEKVFEDLKGDLVKIGRTYKVQVPLALSEKPYVEGPRGKITLATAVLTGTVFWKRAKFSAEYKILRKLGESKPIAGCAIAEVPPWGLIGLSITNETRTLSFVRISVSDRNKKKIYRQKLKRGKADVEDSGIPELPPLD